ncbi:hypothetical protein HHK36_017528 [Tetracentron sinense]|uniref:Protein kinase domain-containing protein n=1 Tax=Tetracentron sinense TaxID=13715 RepID=A0A835DF94_TETSI|nr:hypothetical protein HHK36_017528 [Tetracentron sinense]
MTLVIGLDTCAFSDLNKFGRFLLLFSESPKDGPSVKEGKDDSKLPSNPEEVENLRRDTAANLLIVFTYSELKIITGNFRKDYVLGGGGFGSVYKGFISEDLKKGLQPLIVAVKVHDGDNSYQGVLLPLPWSIRMKIAFDAAKGLAFLHEAETPVIYRDFKTSNILLDLIECSRNSPSFAGPGHLTPKSDVYSFGVVLLELLTGRKSLDKSRPAREQNLADWALPLLSDKKKLLNIVDPRLGEYPVKGVHKAAMLAYHCLNRNPKARPLMRDIVDSLEPLQVAVEVPSVAPTPTVIGEVSGLESQRKRTGLL